jgi:hypothetical protein
MKSAFLLPVVGVAFGLGMVVNRLHSSQDLGGDGRASALSPMLEIGPANGGELTPLELSAWNLSTLSGKVALYQRLSRMHSSGLKALAEGFESYPYDLQRREVAQQIFAAWAEIDPDAACEFAKKVGNLQAKQDFYRALLAVLVDEDLAKARAVLAEIKDPQVRSAAAQSLANSALVESDPDMVLELLAEWGDH